MKIFWLRAFFLALVMVVEVGSGQAFAHRPDLTIYTRDSHPFSYIDEASGSLKGIGYDVLSRLMRETGISHRIIVTDIPFNRVLRDVQESPNTCFLNMNRTPERESLFKWVSPFVEGGWGVFSLGWSAIEIESLHELNDLPVAGVQSYSPVEELRRKGISVVAVPTVQDALDLLYAERVQLVVGGLIKLPLIVREQGKDPIKLVYKWKETELGMGCSLATEDQFIERLTIVNDGLKSFRQEVRQRYLVGPIRR